MSVPASVVLTTARTLLNDDAASLWTDTTLFPKLAQAHRELQVMLRFAASPVMKGSYTEVIAANTGFTFSTPPANLVEPIRLVEADAAGTLSSFVPMTEVDPLPNMAQSATLIYWQWKNETVAFLGATASRTVQMQYWRSLAIPSVNTDLIGFINGELFLAPRVASLAAGSVGNDKLLETNGNLAKQSINEVILSNRGRQPAASGSTMRP